MGHNSMIAGSARAAWIALGLFLVAWLPVSVAAQEKLATPSPADPKGYSLAEVTQGLIRVQDLLGLGASNGGAGSAEVQALLDAICAVADNASARAYAGAGNEVKSSQHCAIVEDLGTLRKQIKNWEKRYRHFGETAKAGVKIHKRKLEELVASQIEKAAPLAATGEDRKEDAAAWWQSQGLISLQLLDRIGREHIRLKRRTGRAVRNEALKHVHARLLVVLQRPSVATWLSILDPDIAADLRSEDPATGLDAAARVSQWVQTEVSKDIEAALNDEKAEDVLCETYEGECLFALAVVAELKHVLKNAPKAGKPELVGGVAPIARPFIDTLTGHLADRKVRFGTLAAFTKRLPTEGCELVPAKPLLLSDRKVTLASLKSAGNTFDAFIERCLETRIKAGKEAFKVVDDALAGEANPRKQLDAVCMLKDGPALPGGLTRQIANVCEQSKAIAKGAENATAAITKAVDAIEKATEEGRKAVLSGSLKDLIQAARNPATVIEEACAALGNFTTVLGMGDQCKAVASAIEKNAEGVKGKVDPADALEYLKTLKTGLTSFLPTINSLGRIGSRLDTCGKGLGLRTTFDEPHIEPQDDGTVRYSAEADIRLCAPPPKVCERGSTSPRSMGTTANPGLAGFKLSVVLPNLTNATAADAADKAFRDALFLQLEKVKLKYKKKPDTRSLLALGRMVLNALTPACEPQFSKALPTFLSNVKTKIADDALKVTLPFEFGDVTKELCVSLPLRGGKHAGADGTCLDISDPEAALKKLQDKFIAELKVKVLGEAVAQVKKLLPDADADLPVKMVLIDKGLDATISFDPADGEATQAGLFKYLSGNLHLRLPLEDDGKVGEVQVLERPKPNLRAFLNAHLGPFAKSSWLAIREIAPTDENKAGSQTGCGNAYGVDLSLKASAPLSGPLGRFCLVDGKLEHTPPSTGDVTLTAAGMRLSAQVDEGEDRLEVTARIETANPDSTAAQWGLDQFGGEITIFLSSNGSVMLPKDENTALYARLNRRSGAILPPGVTIETIAFGDEGLRVGVRTDVDKITDTALNALENAAPELRAALLTGKDAACSFQAVKMLTTLKVPDRDDSLCSDLKLRDELTLPVFGAVKWRCTLMTGNPKILKRCRVEAPAFDRLCNLDGGNSLTMTRKSSNEPVRAELRKFMSCVGDRLEEQLPASLRDLDVGFAANNSARNLTFKCSENSTDLRTCSVSSDVSLDLTNVVPEALRDEVDLIKGTVSLGLDGRLRSNINFKEVGEKLEATLESALRDGAAELADTAILQPLKAALERLEKLIGQTEWTTQIQIANEWKPVKNGLGEFVDALREDRSLRLPTGIRLQGPLELGTVKLEATVTAPYSRDGKLGEPTVTMKCAEAGCGDSLDDVAAKIAGTLADTISAANYPGGATARLETTGNLYDGDLNAELTVKLPFQIDGKKLLGTFPVTITCSVSLKGKAECSGGKSFEEQFYAVALQRLAALKGREVNLGIFAIKVTENPILENNALKLALEARLSFMGNGAKTLRGTASFDLKTGKVNGGVDVGKLTEELTEPLKDSLNELFGVADIIKITSIRLDADAGTTDGLNLPKGLIISSTAKVAGLFGVSIPDVKITKEGLRVKGPKELTLIVPPGLTIPVPPVAICPTGGTLGQERVVVYMAITLAECTTGSQLLALNGSLGITWKDTVLKAEGALTVLAFIRLAEAEAELNIGKQQFSSFIDVGGPIKDIISFRQEMYLQGSPLKAEMQSELQIFRVSINKQHVFILIDGDKSEITVMMKQDLFGFLKGHGAFEAKQGLRNPKLDVGGSARIGGWSLANLDIKATPRIARLKFKVLGTSLTAVIPGFAAINADTLRKMIENLLIPDLRNLDKALLSILKGRITINPMGGFGDGEGEGMDGGNDDGDGGDGADGEGDAPEAGADADENAPAQTQAQAEAQSAGEGAALNPLGRFSTSFEPKGTDGHDIWLMEGERKVERIAFAPASAATAPIFNKAPNGGKALVWGKGFYVHQAPSGKSQMVYTFSGTDTPATGYFDLAKVQGRANLKDGQFRAVGAALLGALSAVPRDWPALTSDKQIHDKDNPGQLRTGPLKVLQHGNLSMVDGKPMAIAQIASGRFLVVGTMNDAGNTGKCTQTPAQPGTKSRVRTVLLTLPEFDTTPPASAQPEESIPAWGDIAARARPILNALSACDGTFVAATSKVKDTLYLGANGYVSKSANGGPFTLVREPIEDDLKKPTPSFGAAMQAGATAAMKAAPVEAKPADPPLPPSDNDVPAGAIGGAQASDGNTYYTITGTGTCTLTRVTGRAINHKFDFPSSDAACVPAGTVAIVHMAGDWAVLLQRMGEEDTINLILLQPTGRSEKAISVTPWQRAYAFTEALFRRTPSGETARLAFNGIVHTSKALIAPTAESGTPPFLWTAPRLEAARLIDVTGTGTAKGGALSKILLKYLTDADVPGRRIQIIDKNLIAFDGQRVARLKDQTLTTVARLHGAADSFTDVQRKVLANAIGARDDKDVPTIHMLPEGAVNDGIAVVGTDRMGQFVWGVKDTEEKVRADVTNEEQEKAAEQYCLFIKNLGVDRLERTLAIDRNNKDTTDMRWTYWKFYNQTTRLTDGAGVETNFILFERDVRVLFSSIPLRWNRVCPGDEEPITPDGWNEKFYLNLTGQPLPSAGATPAEGTPTFKISTSNFIRFGPGTENQLANVTQRFLTALKTVDSEDSTMLAAVPERQELIVVELKDIKEKSERGVQAILTLPEAEAAFKNSVKIEGDSLPLNFLSRFTDTIPASGTVTGVSIDLDATSAWAARDDTGKMRIFIEGDTVRVIENAPDDMAKLKRLAAFVVASDAHTHNVLSAADGENGANAATPLIVLTTGSDLPTRLVQLGQQDAKNPYPYAELTGTFEALTDPEKRDDWRVQRLSSMVAKLTLGESSPIWDLLVHDTAMALSARPGRTEIIVNEGDTFTRTVLCGDALTQRDLNALATNGLGDFASSDKFAACFLGADEKPKQGERVPVRVSKSDDRLVLIGTDDNGKLLLGLIGEEATVVSGPQMDDDLRDAFVARLLRIRGSIEKPTLASIDDKSKTLLSWQDSGKSRFVVGTMREGRACISGIITLSADPQNGETKRVAQIARLLLGKENELCSAGADATITPIWSEDGETLNDYVIKQQASLMPPADAPQPVRGKAGLPVWRASTHSAADKAQPMIRHDAKKGGWSVRLPQDLSNDQAIKSALVHAISQLGPSRGEKLSVSTVGMTEEGKGATYAIVREEGGPTYVQLVTGEKKALRFTVTAQPDMSDTKRRSFRKAVANLGSALRKKNPDISRPVLNIHLQSEHKDDEGRYWIASTLQGHVLHKPPGAGIAFAPLGDLPGDLKDDMRAALLTHLLASPEAFFATSIERSIWLRANPSDYPDTPNSSTQWTMFRGHDAGTVEKRTIVTRVAPEDIDQTALNHHVQNASLWYGEVTVGAVGAAFVARLDGHDGNDCLALSEPKVGGQGSFRTWLRASACVHEPALWNLLETATITDADGVLGGVGQRVWLRQGDTMMQLATEQHQGRIRLLKSGNDPLDDDSLNAAISTLVGQVEPASLSSEKQLVARFRSGMFNLLVSTTGARQLNEAAPPAITFKDSSDIETIWANLSQYGLPMAHLIDAIFDANQNKPVRLGVTKTPAHRLYSEDDQAGDATPYRLIGIGEGEQEIIHLTAMGAFTPEMLASSIEEGSWIGYANDKRQVLAAFDTNDALTTLTTKPNDASEPKTVKRLRDTPQRGAFASFAMPLAGLDNDAQNIHLVTTTTMSAWLCWTQGDAQRLMSIETDAKPVALHGQATCDNAAEADLSGTLVAIATLAPPAKESATVAVQSAGHIAWHRVKDDAQEAVNWALLAPGAMDTKCRSNQSENPSPRMIALMMDQVIVDNDMHCARSSDDDSGAAIIIADPNDNQLAGVFHARTPHCTIVADPLDREPVKLAADAGNADITDLLALSAEACGDGATPEHKVTGKWVRHGATLFTVFDDMMRALKPTEPVRLDVEIKGAPRSVSTVAKWLGKAAWPETSLTLLKQNGHPVLKRTDVPEASWLHLLAHPGRCPAYSINAGLPTSVAARALIFQNETAGNGPSCASEVHASFAGFAPATPPHTFTLTVKSGSPFDCISPSLLAGPDSAPCIGEATLDKQPLTPNEAVSWLLALLDDSQPQRRTRAQALLDTPKDAWSKRDDAFHFAVGWRDRVIIAMIGDTCRQGSRYDLKNAVETTATSNEVVSALAALQSMNGRDRFLHLVSNIGQDPRARIVARLRPCGPAT